MAGKNKWERPSDEELEQLLQQHGSQGAVAGQLGVPHGTISNWYVAAQRRLGRQFKAPAKLNTPEAVEAVSREEVLETELREARAALRKSRKLEVQEERLYNMVAEAIRTTPSRLPDAKPAKASATASNVLLAPLSDTHAGEIVDSEVMDGINEYNWEIMEERLVRWSDGIISHKEHYADPINRLVIAGLGDMLSGSNHEELAETNEFPIAEQCWKFSHTFAELVTRLVPHFASIDIYGVPGNHPRVKKLPANKQVFNNFDWLMYEATGLRLANHQSVNCHFTKAGQKIIPIAGKNIYAFHGDGIRSSMPGVPWGGVMRRTNEIKKDYADRGTIIDYFLLGHFHQTNACSNIWMNGSVKGSDEYVKKQFGAGEAARQLLINFSEKHSRVTGIHYLDLQ